MWFINFEAGSLLRFAHKTSKNRRLGDFLPLKLRKQPYNRGFDGFFNEKSQKNLQVQQAAAACRKDTGLSGCGETNG
jgi:hypothetical protein